MNYIRLFKNTAVRGGMYGAGASLAYSLIFYYLRHHDEETTRPAYIDHTLSVTLLSGVGSSLVATNPV